MFPRRSTGLSWRSVDTACLVLLGIGSTLVILSHPWTPWADQAQLLRCAPALGSYPSLTDGVASCWTSALVALATGRDVVSWNLGFRIVAMWLYLGGALLLARHALESPWARVLALVVVVASRSPFIWLSSEILAGAALCLAVTAVVHGRLPLFTGAALGLLSAVKPDLVLVAVALYSWAFWKAPARPARVRLTLGVAIVALLFVLPGFASYGPEYLHRSPDRAWMSFGQHAGIVLSGELVWEDWETRIQQYFPGAHDVWSAASAYPDQYMSFVRRSATIGLHRANFLFREMVLLAAILVLLLLGRFTRLTSEMKLLGVSLVGVVPMVLLSFPHMRYMARYLPIVVIVLLQGSIGAAERGPRLVRILVAATLFFTLVPYVARGMSSTWFMLAAPLEMHFWGAD